MNRVKDDVCRMGGGIDGNIVIDFRILVLQSVGHQVNAVGGVARRIDDLPCGNTVRAIGVVYILFRGGNAHGVADGDSLAGGGVNLGADLLGGWEVEPE